MNLKLKRPLLAVIGSAFMVLAGSAAFALNGESTVMVDAADSEPKYVKVTEQLTDWSGSYLIVSVDGYAYNGGTGNTKDSIPVSFLDDGNSLVWDSSLETGIVTISSSGSGKYEIQTASGTYFSYSGSGNGFSVSNSPASYSINYVNEKDGVDIQTGSEAHLRFNSSTSELRFRFFKNSTYTGQKAINLFALSESTDGEPAKNVERIEIAEHSESIRVGETLKFTATAYPEDASNKAIDWSVDDPSIAEISDDGVLYGIKPGIVVVTASAADGSGVTVETIVEIEELVGNYTAYKFSDSSDFAAWKESSYLDSAAISFNDLDTTFARAMKPADSPTNLVLGMPVTKRDKNSTVYPYLSISSKNGRTMDSLIVNFKQWGVKVVSVKLETGNSFDSLTTVIDEFVVDGSKTMMSFVAPEPFTHAKITVIDDGTPSSPNQLGWESLNVLWTYDATAFATEFMAVELCDGGYTQPDTNDWKNLENSYALLSEEDKAIMQNANADELSESIIENCVARYDYIVGKYGANTYSDFMNRSPEPLGYSLGGNTNQMIEQTATWACVGILFLSAFTAGSAFIIKRRREGR